MISFGVNQLYVLDLKDDFLMNHHERLYDFIGQDPIKAYQLGIRVEKWFDLLDKEQQYLHAKDLRHVKADLEEYLDQINYWTKKFPGFEEEEVDILGLSEYVYNNMILNPETEEADRIKLALFLGMITGRSVKDEGDEDSLFNVHNPQKDEKPEE